MYDLCITEINAKIEKKRIIMEFLSTALLFPRLRMKAQSMNNTWYALSWIELSSMKSSCLRNYLI